MTAHAPQAPTFDGTQPCAAVDPELFFADTEGHRADVAAARAVCGPCGFRTACLAYALEQQEWGIWAGTTQQERRPVLLRLGVHAPVVRGVGRDWDEVYGLIDRLDDGTRRVSDIARHLGISRQVVTKQRRLRTTRGVA